jgi:hypothetical protein
VDLLPLSIYRFDNYKHQLKLVGERGADALSQEDQSPEPGPGLELSDKAMQSKWALHISTAGHRLHTLSTRIFACSVLTALVELILVTAAAFIRVSPSATRILRRVKLAT